MFATPSEISWTGCVPYRIPDTLDWAHEFPPFNWNSMLICVTCIVLVVVLVGVVFGNCVGDPLFSSSSPLLLILLSVSTSAL